MNVSSPSGVACLEVFDENSQPSAEEISEYAEQIGIDPQTESHLLPIAKDGLMKALPPPWKAYYDEKLSTHYYFNEETKKTQWEHPLDFVYREIVRKARDQSLHEDTYTSVQEIVSYEEQSTKNNVESRAGSDEELTINSEKQTKVSKSLLFGQKRLTPMARPSSAPKTSQRRFSDMQTKNFDIFYPKQQCSQTKDDIKKLIHRPHSEIIDLQLNVPCPDVGNFGLFKQDMGIKGFQMLGKSDIFRKNKKTDRFQESKVNNSASIKTDAPKGILREKISGMQIKKTNNVSLTDSIDEDKKSVRFNLDESNVAQTSHSSNTSENNSSGGGSLVDQIKNEPMNNLVSLPKDLPKMPMKLAPLMHPPHNMSLNLNDKKSTCVESIVNTELNSKRRILHPPAADFINADLFNKDFQKISDLVKPAETHLNVENPSPDRKKRPRSPMIPPTNKISINLMESIDSEASSDSAEKDKSNLETPDLVIKKPVTKPEPISSVDFIQIETDDENVPEDERDNIECPPTKYISPRSNTVQVIDTSKSIIQIETDILKSEDLTDESSSQNLDLSKSIIESKHNRVTLNQDTPNRTQYFRNNLTSKLDGMILSQVKSYDGQENVVVMYQFEQPDDNSVGQGDVQESVTGSSKTKAYEAQAKMLEEEKRLEGEWAEKLNELNLKHTRLLEEAIAKEEAAFEQKIKVALAKMESKYSKEMTSMEEKFHQELADMHEEYFRKLQDERKAMEKDSDRSLHELQEYLKAKLNSEKNKILEENRVELEVIRNEQATRVADLRHDYRAEVERLRSQHACHLEELRAKLASERAAATKRNGNETHDLADKYRCLKEKYARLKHDVKVSIERRNKRREMSMTTGSETEKSNSNKATPPTLERCKELNEELIASNQAPECVQLNNNMTNTSVSELRKQDNNNSDWKSSELDNNILSPETSKTSSADIARIALAFKEPQRRRYVNKEKQNAAPVTSDAQDSSEATIVNERSKDNGKTFRNFTRLKSASTSRLNYSPKRGECWTSPIEALRQQLRKLDDLEDQFPDLACNTSYKLRYPFAEVGGISDAETPEIEFLRHRALIEREGMRRARAVLRKRRAALRENRASVSPHRPLAEERESTELEVALHRARALLGEKAIRLRHIERSLRRITQPHSAPPTIVKESASDVSSASDTEMQNSEGVANVAVLRSLKALHADVRDIWRALDARQHTSVSPDTSSCNMASASQPRMSFSVQESVHHDLSDDRVVKRAKELKAWLNFTH